MLFKKAENSIYSTMLTELDEIKEVYPDLEVKEFKGE
jgi:hypothetical protein